MPVCPLNLCQLIIKPQKATRATDPETSGHDLEIEPSLTAFLPSEYRKQEVSAGGQRAKSRTCLWILISLGRDANENNQSELMESRDALKDQRWKLKDELNPRNGRNKSKMKKSEFNTAEINKVLIQVKTTEAQRK